MEKIAKYIQPITKKSVYLVDFVEVPKEEGMDLEEESREERKPLEEEIEYYEYWVRYCIELYGDLSASLKFYQDKMDTYYSNPTPSAPLREARELIEVCMLNLLISEMTYVKEAFDTIPNVAKKGLLPYVSEGLDISVGMNSLGTVYSFKNDFFPLEARAKEETDTLTATRLRTNEVASALQESIVNYYCFKYPHDSKFNNLLERYKNEHVGDLTLWEERRIGEFKEELIKLDDEFKEEPAVRCWFEAGGNILETLKKMYLNHLVMKDLLPLLKYVARYDLLRAREKGEVEQKDENGKKDDKRKKILFASEAVKKKECNRLKNFLTNNPNYNKGWSSSKENPTTDVVLCFVKHWVEQGSIEADYPVSTLVEWVVKECGVKLEGVDMKTLSNKMRDWKRNGKKIDSEIEKRVGVEFKNK